MAIIKCKMCGGDIELAADKTFGTCEFCGSTMTLPKIDDDQRAAAFNRGNHFRRIGEFDKALAVYERIVRENDTDAEAHWCCALCRFGIEYVEDPATYEYLPTCHRASFDSFLEDVDYLAAVEHSEGITKRQYQKDGAKIAEVQRGILATSHNEEPFDVFICYKESDENGERTRDSLMAQDVYYQLTDQGYRVFFARITLEDVVGKQYEPYIFAALNSAKVMIAIGTKPEYMNAVWVKNEWSRFLAMMKKDRHKILLPCYKDMDPYDMPEQLSVLQSYDMSKIGFIQDLIRGIKKVLDAEKKPEQAKETVVTGGGNANTAPLLKRAFMFLEDGDWNSADEYCEKVLDIDPECAEAYLGKLMVELNVTSRQNLKNCSTPFDGRNNFQKAMRFADENLKKELQGYIDFIINRNLTNAYNDAVRAMKSASTEEAYKKASAKFKELHDFKDSKELAKECLDKAEEARLTVLYNTAMSAMNSANTEQQYKSAAGKFSAIKTFRDAGEKAKLCLEKAEISRKDAIYDSAVSSMSEGTISAYKKAIDAFKTIEEWKDSSTKIYDCERSIYEIEQKEEADRIEAARLAEEKRLEEERIAEEKRIEAERLAEEKRIADAKAAKKRKIIISITTPVVCACIAFVIILNTIIIPNGKYEDALALISSKKYSDAVTLLDEIPDYKDAGEKRKEALYLYAVSYQDSEQYENAITTFEQIKDYKDSNNRIDVCKTAILDNKYSAALALMQEGKYENAITAFEEIKTHKDSTTQISTCMSTLAQNYASKGDTANAIKWYEKMGDKESANKVRYDYVLANKNSTNTTTYEYLKTLKSVGYKDASNIYSSLYKVTGKVFFNESRSDTSTSKTTIHSADSSGYNDAYCHFSVTGGTPGTEIKVRIVYETRWGTDNNPREPYKVDTDTEFTVKPGEDNIFFYFDLASNLYYHRVTLYNVETGEQLAQATLYSLYLR